jgi:hypothetical protein
MQRSGLKYLSTSLSLKSSSFLTAGFSILVYLLTRERDLTWANWGGDGGELITAAVTWGVPHPPGYPTYVLLGNLFGRLPFGTVAFRFHLLSALGTAVGAAFVTATVYRLGTEKNGRWNRGWLLKGGGVWRSLTAVSAGLTFSFGALVWSQAIIAEVYGLNLALVGAAVYCLLSDRQDKGFIVLTGILLGLSITTHLTSLLLLPPALLLVSMRRWHWLASGTIVGLLPLLLLPLLAQSGSPVVWSRPDTVEGWWWLVSGQLYRPNVLGLPTAEWTNRLSAWGLPFLAQFAYIGIPVMVIGILIGIREQRQKFLGLMLSAVLYGIYAFTYRTSDAAVLFLPGLLLLSVVLGFGLHFLGKAAIMLTLFLLWLNLGQPEPGYYVNMAAPVRPAAEMVIESVPDNAILMTAGDPSIAAFWYFHHVEGKRPDIVVIDANLFQFDWYREQLARDYPLLRHLTDDDLPGFIEINRQIRPVCEVSLVEPGYNNC